MSTTAKPGDTVAVHYTGRLDDGSVFDTSKDRDPLQFVVGERRIIPGFEKAVIGMSPGETKITDVPAEEAYGPRRSELVLDFPRDQIPPDLAANVGQELQVQTRDGQAVPAVVVATSNSAITVDANHPLAGRDLTFEIEMLDVIAL